MRPDSKVDRLARMSGRLVASVRGRRLMFVAGLAPGLLSAVAGAQIWQSPGLLAFGLVLLVLVIAARGMTEPRLLARQPPRLQSMPREPSS